MSLDIIWGRLVELVSTIPERGHRTLWESLVGAPLADSVAAVPDEAVAGSVAQQTPSALVASVGSSSSTV